MEWTSDMLSHQCIIIYLNKCICTVYRKIKYKINIGKDVDAKKTKRKY